MHQERRIKRYPYAITNPSDNFTHMTVKIVGKGLEALAEGLSRQVDQYIQG